jgi:ABC-type phosphate/phosphonate transport system permease subunit
MLKRKPNLKQEPIVNPGNRNRPDAVVRGFHTYCRSVDEYIWFVLCVVS